MDEATAAPSAEIPHTRLINFVDQPATIKYSQFGQGQVQLNAPTGGILDVSQFRRVHICGLDQSHFHSGVHGEDQ
jgi:hypothetical protein